MIDILNVEVQRRGKPYDKFNAMSRIVDRLKCGIDNKVYIKDINLNIHYGYLPQNRNKTAYSKNIYNIKRKMGVPRFLVSPRGIRNYDYNLLNEFQRKVFAYSVVKSIQLVLRKTNKSLKNSTILVDDSLDPKAYNILEELSKQCRHIVLLSKDIKKTSKVQQKIIANFGISPEITYEEEYAVKISDFVISTRDKVYGYCDNIWYINNIYEPYEIRDTFINDISFKSQWSNLLEDISPELIGAILCQMSEKDIETSLRYNGLFIDKIKFNERLIVL
ncbi:hypothetical protein [Clostridium amazonitimonense]|uniref:hypothetical protein n=1 Tax=Clostridium amazonitimonense TaxID=1499689 RepID=UPI0005099389|nr:hypothetical protein [Clostridium amazonitimonense]